MRTLCTLATVNASTGLTDTLSGRGSGGESEWLTAYRLLYGAAAQALRADTHGLGGTVRCGYLQSLQVGSELAPRDAGDFRTHATQIFCLTSGFYLIA
jgi:hypothetical protein